MLQAATSRGRRALQLATPAAPGFDGRAAATWHEVRFVSDVEASRAQDFLELLARSRQGRLKVYLGYAPGVGKTARMLHEAQVLRQRGVDVVLGFVDVHARADLEAACEGMAVVPRRRVTYRGITVEDLDLDAVLRRRPSVAVVDDLARASVPGGRHRRRYEDALALLDVGIHVIGAFNVQHLESLNDTVRRATGVVVDDTVPDAFLARADQVVNVDVPVDELLERVRAGKVTSRAPAALLAPESLDALREIALRELAEDAHRRRQRRGEASPAAEDRVIVAISSRSPHAKALLRRGSRLAGHLNARWYVVYVATPRDRRDPGAREALAERLELARSLGAEVVQVEGGDVAASLLEFARRHGAHHVVVGAPLRRTWRDRLFGSIADRLVRGGRGIGVHVLTFDEEGAA